MTTPSNTPDREIWPDYVRAIADCMALRDWTFEISPQVAKPGCNAQIAPLRGRKCAHIRLSASFSQFPPEVQRHAIVHEMLHCHLAPCQHVAEDALTKRLFPCFELNLEFGIDGIADAIAPLFPLPLQ